jgi:hypothetical protein
MAFSLTEAQNPTLVLSNYSEKLTRRRRKSEPHFV